MAVAKIPSGPKGQFLMGNTLQYMGDSLGFLTRTAREFGDIVKIRLGLSTYYLLIHPTLVEEGLARTPRMSSRTG